MPRPKFEFQDHAWELRRMAPPECANEDGHCEWETKCLYIHHELTGERLVEIAIHEGLHADLPDLGEHAVTRAAGRIAALVWYVLNNRP